MTREEELEMRCPKCNGVRYLRVPKNPEDFSLGPVYTGEKIPWNDSYEVVTIKCDHCDGTGRR